MSDNHLADRQRDASKISSTTANKYIIASTGESILYTTDLKDDDFQDENDPNQISILNANEPEYEDDFANANSRMRSNSLDKNKKKPQKTSTQQQQQQQQAYYSQMKSNQRNKKTHHHHQSSGGYYYQNPEQNEEFEYYQDDNEEFNDDQDESYAVQQPLNRMNMQQKLAVGKIVKSDSHLSKPILMSSTSNLNAVNNSATSNQGRQAHQSGQHHQKATQGYSSPLKHSNPNNNQSPKPNNLNINNHHHVFGYEVDPNDDKIDLWGHLLIGLSYLFLVFSFPFSLCACVKVAQEYERAVIFRLGRILQGGAKGPGIFFVLPCIDTYIKVDLRTVTFDVPPQEILTRDSVTVSVDAVVYFRIFNAVISVINVEDAAKSTKLLAASTLRNILGTKSLHEILSDRESVAISIQNNLDEATEPWGVKVERVEVKDVRLPVQLQRAMATEAEAAREARAKVIAAEGEQKASKALKEAAEVISESPIAIQLRYLQTLTQIASERNSTIVFPIPLEMLSFLANKSATVFKPVKT